MVESSRQIARQAVPPVAVETPRLVLVRLSLQADDNECDRLRQFLSGPERERSQRRVVAVRRRAVVSRGRLRMLLGQVLGMPPAAVPLETNAHGKPFLAGPQDWGCQFNMSHTGDEGLIALATDQPVGVDLECRKPSHTADWARLMAGTIFGDAELSRWQAQPHGQQAMAVLDAWVAKEAIFKAIGTGIGDRLRQCELPVSMPRVVAKDGEPSGDCQLASVALPVNLDGNETCFGVTLIDLESGCHAAVALPAQRASVVLTSFDRVLREGLSLA